MSNLLMISLEAGAGDKPYLVGGGILLLLVILLLITVAIGGGREHS